MTRSLVSRLPLAAALVASVMLHLLVAALVVGSSEANAGFESRLESPAVDEVTPGIAESGAVTVSWIGFSDPTPHTGLEAETEQAQVSPDAGEAAREALTAAQQAVQDAAENAADAAEAIRDRVAPVLERGTVLAEALRDQAIVAARRQEAQAAAERAAAARAARAAEEGSQDAIPDERDAVATASEAQLVYTAGQPLARQGLQIATVRPVFDAATRVLELRAARRQPVVAISFARDGTVSGVEFVGGGTGIRSIDEPIKTAVFRWTARGSDLDELPAGDPDAAVTVQIRFSL
ncbi:MAG: hypothetical protein AAFR76_00875 [Planctomycetota bacterium]